VEPAGVLFPEFTSLNSLKAFTKGPSSDNVVNGR
jgi:hypothetical protein